MGQLAVLGLHRWLDCGDGSIARPTDNQIHIAAAAVAKFMNLNGGAAMFISLDTAWRRQ